MVNVNKLRGAVVEHGFTMESLANSIGMDRATLYRKIANNGENFTLKEVDGIVRALSLTPDEGMRIFLPRMSHKMRQQNERYSMESITIDFDRVPEKEKRVLGDTLFTACKAFYENPDNLARYNAWKAKREAAHV